MAEPVPWRLLRDGAASGAWNMGVDEALLATASESGRATLRLYAWDGPWLSLGHAQPAPGPLAQACTEAGVGLVRRATGGSAVLHGSDLTYAVAVPESALPPGLQGSYARVAEALSLALASLGLRTRRAPGGPSPRGFDCFQQAGGDEICVGERKLVGSAQRRSGGAVLQHGSIRLAPDPRFSVATCTSSISTSVHSLL